MALKSNMSIEAGAAALEINPPEGIQLCGYPHIERISTGVHDTLWATLAGASLFESGLLKLHMKKLHIAIGRLWQETNSFSQATTGLKEFRQYTYQVGEALMKDFRSCDDELAGFADVLDPLNVSYVPLISASTWCGGPLEEEVVTSATAAILNQLDKAPKLDGIVFSMHGALSGNETPDVEGHVLAAIRKEVGPRLPIVLTLDHHGNVTRRMVEAVDALTAFRNCPHTDMRETGGRGARLLLSILSGELKPTLSYRKIPLVTPCECFRTSELPLKAWFDRARAFENEPDVVDVSLFPVQPWLDVPEMGWSVVVVTNDRKDLAEEVSLQLAEMGWAERKKFYVKKYEPAEAIRKAAAASEGPVVIADGADATNGGSPGDSTALLKEMLDQNITCKALLTMVDREVVAQAYKAGLNQTIQTQLGAKISTRYHQPVSVNAKIVGFSDGRFEIKGHIAMQVNMGRCVLLEIGFIQVMVSEFAGPGHDPEVFRQIGAEPKDAQIVVVKSTVGHMDAYRNIMKESLPCECLGPSPSYLERLDYQRVQRPLYPLDRNIQWQIKRALT